MNFDHQFAGRPGQHGISDAHLSRFGIGPLVPKSSNADNLFLRVVGIDVERVVLFALGMPLEKPLHRDQAASPRPGGRPESGLFKHRLVAAVDRHGPQLFSVRRGRDP